MKDPRKVSASERRKGSVGAKTVLWKSGSILSTLAHHCWQDLAVSNFTHANRRTSYLRRISNVFGLDRRTSSHNVASARWPKNTCIRPM